MTDDQREILRKIRFSSMHKYLEMRAGHAGTLGSGEPVSCSNISEASSSNAFFH